MIQPPTRARKQRSSGPGRGRGIRRSGLGGVPSRQRIAPGPGRRGFSLTGSSSALARVGASGRVEGPVLDDVKEGGPPGTIEDQHVVGRVLGVTPVRLVSEERDLCRFFQEEPGSTRRTLAQTRCWRSPAGAPRWAARRRCSRSVTSPRTAGGRPPRTAAHDAVRPPVRRTHRGRPPHRRRRPFRLHLTARHSAGGARCPLCARRCRRLTGRPTPAAHTARRTRPRGPSALGGRRVR
jgi:hypothetical protein